MNPAEDFHGIVPCVAHFNYSSSIEQLKFETSFPIHILFNK